MNHIAIGEGNQYYSFIDNDFSIYGKLIGTIPKRDEVQEKWERVLNRQFQGKKKSKKIKYER